jgi:hypothetical protein
MSRFFRDVDGASLAVFRIAFAAILIAAIARYVAHGWVDQFFVAPSYFFPYEGFGWIAPLPRPAMYALYAVIAIAAGGVLLGFWYRASAIILGCAFTYAHLIDKTNYLNHYDLVSLLCLLLAFVPAHRVWSIDALRRGYSRFVPGWSVDLLRFQLAVVYFFGGLAKLNADWLLAASPLRIWLAANADLPLVGWILERTWVAYAFSWAGLAFDCSVPFLLARRKTRGFAYAAVVVFHLSTAALFPIGIFPWLMIALTPIFFDADWPRRLAGRPAAMTNADPVRVAALSLWRRCATVSALAADAAIQITVPLRHWLEPGDLLWTERGFRFSWQVMAMEKYGKAEFRVRDPQSGETWRVSPKRYLTPAQARMMATQPDMILSFARFLADDFAARGVVDAEVRGDVWVTLNGRPHRRYVDPRVNLAGSGVRADGRGWIVP